MTRGDKPRIDGKWTIEQVYDAFVDDPIWHVKKDDYGYVSFRERKEKETYKKNRQFTMMLFVHYITKHTWKLTNSSANLVIYGGFARSAMIAWHACKSAVYTTILCCQRIRVSRDVYKMIAILLLDTWFRDFTWFQDKVRDVDILVSYHNRYKPGGPYEFKWDVWKIVKILGELCSRTPECAHSFIKEDKYGERNCRRRGQTSHRSGEYYNYLAYFESPDYVGEKVTRYSSTIQLDITTMIENDQSDTDVNNLVLYFDHARQTFRFGQRKKIVFREGVLTLKQIESHVARRLFRHVPMDYKAFGSFQSFKKVHDNILRRISNLEYRHWKQDPNFPMIDPRNYESTLVKAAERYFQKRPIDRDEEMHEEEYDNLGY